MDTIYCRKIAVTYGKIFSEVVNILQTNSYFPRAFFEIFTFFIIYPPGFANSTFQNLRQKFRAYAVINVTRNYFLPLPRNDPTGNRNYGLPANFPLLLSKNPDALKQIA